MQGKRKSPFFGKTVPISDGKDPILYPRYTNPADILLSGTKPAGAPAAASTRAAPPLVFAAASGSTDEGKLPSAERPAEGGLAAVADGLSEQAPAQKQRKKARWTEDRKEAAKSARAPAAPAAVRAQAVEVKGAEPAVGAAVGAVQAAGEDTKKEKKKKKEKTPALRKLEPEERVSGPGNADEAEKIRAALGFAAPAAAAAAAPAAPAAVAPATFAFGFAVRGATGRRAASGSQDAEDRGDNDDSDGEEDGGAGAGEAAAAPSAQDASSSEEESSSGDEEEAPAASPAPAPAPAPAARPLPGAPTSAATDAEFVPRRVYVGGMPFSYAEQDVREFWEYCGAIESLDLLSFPDTGRFRGIAFVTYATEEGYQAALACDGEDCDGQTLKVQKCRRSAKDRRVQQAAVQQQQQEQQQQMASAAVRPAVALAPAPQAPAPARPVHAAPAPKVAGYDVAYVGNIAYEADEAAVRSLFEPYGVTKVRIHTDKDSGRPKGFAHVHFKDEASLDSAMVLDGTQLMGRRIRVGYAQQKKERPAVPMA